MAKTTKEILAERRAIQGFRNFSKKKESAKSELFAKLKQLHKSKKSGAIEEEKYISEKESIIEEIINNNNVSREETYKFAAELFRTGAITSEEYDRIVQDSLDDSLKNAPEVEEYKQEKKKKIVIRCGRFAKIILCVAGVIFAICLALGFAVFFVKYIVPILIGLFLLDVIFDFTKGTSYDWDNIGEAKAIRREMDDNRLNKR